MKNLFFYGTLRHIPLLEAVLGRQADTLDLVASELADYIVTGVTEGPFPTITPRPGAIAEGILVRGLDETDIARLDFYEGSFDYDLVGATLKNGEACEFYISPAGRWTPTQPWSLNEWVTEHGEMALNAAGEVMRLMGVKTRDEVAVMFPRIRARAASRMRGGQEKPDNGTFRGKVDVTRISPGYAHFFALDDVHLRHERFDGTLSGEIERAALISTDAAIVLPYDPVRDRVLVVEQVRIGPIMRGDPAAWQFEPVAGLIDAGETPQDAARREAGEEAGLSLTTLLPVAEVYSSPGNSTGFYYIYVGLTDLPDDSAGHGGLDEEGEDIRSHLMSLDDLMALVDGRLAVNAPLVIAAYWLARNRDGLRSPQGADTA
ncbi:MAG: NUDIX domain-containing protein [Sulfitobacter sp.]